MLILSLLLAAAEPALPSIVVVDLKPAAAADDAIAKLATSALVEAVAARSRGTANVMGLAEASALIDTQARQHLLGCDDERCAADLSNVLKADQIVAGRVGTIGGRLVAFVSLVDVKTATVVARASTDTPRTVAALQAALAKAALDLNAPPAAKVGVTTAALAAALFSGDDRDGDDRLSTLRIAVLIDEFDENGAPTVQHPIEACVQRGLLDAGADAVSPAVIAALHKQTSAREVLAGRVPESLGSDDVDVILAGAAEIKAAGGFASALKFEAQATVQLVKIDTGDVLVSERIIGQGLEHTPSGAARRAVEKLCERATPQLKEALDRRVARGERVVLQLDGALSTEEANALMRTLETKVARVGRVRLKKLTKDKAIFDVVLKSGDGAALALDLGDGVPLALVEVTAGVLKGTWRGGPR